MHQVGPKVPMPLVKDLRPTQEQPEDRAKPSNLARELARREWLEVIEKLSRIAPSQHVLNCQVVTAPGHQHEKSEGYESQNTQFQVLPQFLPNQSFHLRPPFLKG